MPIDFEQKFRTTGLDPEDCGLLRSTIIKSKDHYEMLVSHLYIYGRSCNECADILSICDHYIRAEPTPGLTAICMRVVIDYWDRWQEYCNELERYLDISIFDEWYDEVLFAVSFVKTHNQLLFTPAIMRRMMKLKSSEQAKKLGIV